MRQDVCSFGGIQVALPFVAEQRVLGHCQVLHKVVHELRVILGDQVDVVGLGRLYELSERRHDQIIMLEWCRNQQEESEPSEIMMHAPPSTTAMPRLDTTTHNPNASMLSSHNTRKHTQRPKKGITLSTSVPVRTQKGITVHSHRSLREQQAASNESTPKRMVSSWTQTSRILANEESQPTKRPSLGTPERNTGGKGNEIHWG